MVGKIFMIKKFESIALWMYVIENLNSEEIARTFYEKELQKVEKWKGQDNLLNR